MEYSVKIKETLVKLFLDIIDKKNIIYNSSIYTPSKINDLDEELYKICCNLNELGKRIDFSLNLIKKISCLKPELFSSENDSIIQFINELTGNNQNYDNYKFLFNFSFDNIFSSLITIRDIFLSKVLDFYKNLNVNQKKFNVYESGQKSSYYALSINYPNSNLVNSIKKFVINHEENDVKLIRIIRNEITHHLSLNKIIIEDPSTIKGHSSNNDLFYSKDFLKECGYTYLKKGQLKFDNYTNTITDNFFKYLDEVCSDFLKDIHNNNMVLPI